MLISQWLGEKTTNAITVEGNRLGRRNWALPKNI